MPRLYPPFSNAVFFLHALTEKGLSTPAGSGVIIGDYDPTGPVTHHYAVTAAHVVQGGASVISINTEDGKTRTIELDCCEWTFKPDWEDIAIVDITERIDQRKDKINYIPYSMFATQGFISYVELGIGEDGFMLGLFSAHSGTKQNMIAARFGNISLLANEEAPITRAHKRGPTVTSPCHVFDMRSRPGFSGSPVFVYRTPDGDLRDLERRIRTRYFKTDRLAVGTETEFVETDYENNRFIKLLGIHVSQFHEKTTVNKVTGPTTEIGEDEDALDADALKNKDAIRFPGSMTIVVPAWQISKLLEDSSLVQKREARKSEAQKNHNAQSFIAVEEGVALEEEGKPEPEPDNPSHKEDFTRLLGAAARPRKPASET